jgi:hypothetical protein
MSNVLAFRKKPVEIQAKQFDGTPAGAREVADWIEANDENVVLLVGQNSLVIETLEGDMHVDPFDWVIRGVKGEFYPCKPDIFTMTYDSVPDPNEVKVEEETKNV